MLHLNNISAMLLFTELFFSISFFFSFSLYRIWNQKQEIEIKNSSYLFILCSIACNIQKNQHNGRAKVCMFQVKRRDCRALYCKIYYSHLFGMDYFVNSVIDTINHQKKKLNFLTICRKYIFFIVDSIVCFDLKTLSVYISKYIQQFQNNADVEEVSSLF